VHVALVTNKQTSRYVNGLRRRADELGVLDRLHLVPYVPHWQVVPMLSSATAGVIPIQHWPNHEVALITKFFEYSHARLPMVVSDVRTMSATVRATGQGEVFKAEDLADYIRAVRAVLGDPERYRSAYDKPGLLDGWTWAAQAEVLTSVYRRVLGD
jgi:glycosyltransferase involved in cell wall biosynthesis